MSNIDTDLQLEALHRMQVEDPAALRQHISALQAERESLENAYETGDSDMTYSEHRARMREYDHALTDLSSRAAEAGALSRIKTAAEFDAWGKSVERLRQSSKGRAVDYTRDSKAEDLLDRHLKFLGSDPANANRSAAWFLETAHKMTMERLTGGHGDDALAVKNASGLKGMELERALARMSPEEAEAWLSS